MSKLNVVSLIEAFGNLYAVCNEIVSSETIYYTSTGFIKFANDFLIIEDDYSSDEIKEALDEVVMEWNSLSDDTE